MSPLDSAYRLFAEPVPVFILTPSSPDEHPQDRGTAAGQNDKTRMEVTSGKVGRVEGPTRGGSDVTHGSPQLNSVGVRRVRTHEG